MPISSGRIPWRLLLAFCLTFAAAYPADYDDIAKSVGLTHTTLFGSAERNDYIIETTGVGVAVFDYDGDGDNDILIPNGALVDPPAGFESPVPHLYQNDGRGDFTEVAQSAGLTATGWGQGLCVGDYDGDGQVDLLLTRWGTNVLYRIENGEFTDVTASAKLPTTGRRWGTGCSFLDYDRDGDLDVFVANYVDLDLSKTPSRGGAPTCFWKDLPVFCGPRSLPKARNALYRNEGDGSFRDVSEAAGILTPGPRYGLGVIVADFNDDAWPDIYVACDQTASLLYMNNQSGGFDELAGTAGVAYNFDGQTQAGMGVAVADYDGNGFIDIVKTNFQDDLPSLYFNEDGQFFTDYAQQAGLGSQRLLGWGVAFVDADEDTWPDIVMAHGHIYPEVEGAGLGETYAQRTLFFHNQGDATFEDATAAAGSAFQQLRPARGLAIGDLDGDGHPEIVLANVNTRPSLLKNRAPGHNRAVIRLGDAVGARVRLTAAGRTQTQFLHSGASYLSQHALELYFGLGAAETIDKLEVRWPDGETQEWTALGANQILGVTQGAAAVRAAPLQLDAIQTSGAGQ